MYNLLMKYIPRPIADRVCIDAHTHSITIGTRKTVLVGGTQA